MTVYASNTQRIGDGSGTTNTFDPWTAVALGLLPTFTRNLRHVPIKTNEYRSGTAYRRYVLRTYMIDVSDLGFKRDDNRHTSSSSTHHASANERLGKSFSRNREIRSVLDKKEHKATALAFARSSPTGRVDKPTYLIGRRRIRTLLTVNHHEVFVNLCRHGSFGCRRDDIRLHVRFDFPRMHGLMIFGRGRVTESLGWLWSSSYSRPLPLA